MSGPVKGYEEKDLNEFFNKCHLKIRQRAPPENSGLDVIPIEIILGLGFSFSYPQSRLALDSYPKGQY